LRLEIAYDPHLAQGDANTSEIAGDIEGIFVLGAPRQDLFTDDDERGSDGVARCVFHIRRLTYPTLGVLLWTLLEKAHPIDEPGKNASLKHTLLITGRDSYAVALALSEIDPHYEGKQVIVAYSGGEPAASMSSLRVVVPGDAHCGRSVRGFPTIELR